LYSAVWNGHEACVRVLIAAGANPNVVNTDGETPLIWATRSGHEACVRALIEAGADPNADAQIRRDEDSWGEDSGEEVTSKCTPPPVPKHWFWRAFHNLRRHPFAPLQHRIV